MDRIEALEALDIMVSGKRYRHSVRCADCAYSLAIRYGADPEKAWITGLLHDISRGQSNETIREWALLDKGSLSPYEENHFNVLHSYASAWYLREALGLRDESLLDAVRYHTTGSPRMDLLAKVVFAADYMEPGRDHLNKKDRDRLLELPLDKLILIILEATDEYLVKKGIPLSPDSRELYRLLSKR